jgi:hypothetical protein
MPTVAEWCEWRGGAGRGESAHSIPRSPLVCFALQRGRRARQYRPRGASALAGARGPGRRPGPAGLPMPREPSRYRREPSRYRSRAASNHTPPWSSPPGPTGLPPGPTHAAPVRSAGPLRHTVGRRTAGPPCSTATGRWAALSQVARSIESNHVDSNSRVADSNRFKLSRRAVAGARPAPTLRPAGRLIGRRRRRGRGQTPTRRRRGHPGRPPDEA